MKNKDVFINRLLNLRKIKYLGFDMDHTLIRYNTKAFESLVYQLVIERLIQIKHYPKRLRELKFNFTASIRGLVIDCKKGNVIKLSRHGAIRKSYHGTQEIPFIEQGNLYNNQYIDLNDKSFLVIDTAFSIAFCALYAQLIDLKDKIHDELPAYHTIADDLLTCHDMVHGDGSLKSYVSKRLPEFIIKDEKVVEGLLRFKKHKKKLFILTNSEYEYTKVLLDYAITPFLDGEKSWIDLFDFVITLADKPRFFYDNLKFLKINTSDGLMSNVRGRLEPGVYQGGCAQKFTKSVGVDGDEILYIGDHIYGDIVRLKKECNWRTALVVEELSHEIDALHKSRHVSREIEDLMEEKEPLEQKMTDMVSLEIESKSKSTGNEIQLIHQKILELDKKIAELINQHQALFNKYWGPIFRAGAEESYFAYQMDRFACIYMEKISDFLEYSPRHYFRATKRLLAHELEVKKGN